MDAGQIAELRAWASRLAAREDDEELRAAGKAILLLVDEVERLQPGPATVEPARDNTVATEAHVREELEPAGQPAAEEPASLRNRLRRTFGYGGESQ